MVEVTHLPRYEAQLRFWVDFLMPHGLESYTSVL